LSVGGFDLGQGEGPPARFFMSNEQQDTTQQADEPSKRREYPYKLTHNTTDP